MRARLASSSTFAWVCVLLVASSCLLTIDESKIPGEGGGGGAGRGGAGGGAMKSGCAVQRPGLVFCDDFETDDFSRWDDTDGNLAPLHRIVADAGAFAREANHVAVLDGRSDLTKILPTTSQRLFVRWYARMAPGYDFDGSSFFAGFLAGERAFIGADQTAPDGENVYNAYFGQRFSNDLRTAARYVGMYQQTCPTPCGSDVFPCVPGGGVTCSVPAHEQSGSPPAIADETWYCFELMIDAGTASTDGSIRDGSVSTWLDDAPVGNWGGLWMRGSASFLPSFLWIAGGAADGAPGVLVDDVVIATARVGCD